MPRSKVILGTWEGRFRLSRTDPNKSDLSCDAIGRQSERQMHGAKVAKNFGQHGGLAGMAG